MNTRFITTEEELISLRNSWDQLVSGNPETDMPFFSWDWFYRSWLHFGKPIGQELAIITVEGDGQLIGILPLICGSKKSSGISYRTLEFCNTGMMPRNTFYFDPNQNIEAVFQAVWDQIFAEHKRWDMLEFANVPELVKFHDLLLENRSETSYALIQTQGFIAPYIELNGTLDSYYEILGSGTRKDLRRRLGKFKDFGDAKAIRFFETPDEILEGLDLLFKVHSRSWKGEFSNPHYREFYKEVTPTLSERGEVIVAVASLGEEPISAGYILTNKNVYFSLINDHDMKFRDTAPGIILFIYELDHLLKNGKKIFDFCGTTYDYKERLSKERLSHSTFQVFHRGLKSQFIYTAKTFLLPLIRKILKKPEPNDFIFCKKRY